jgi:hypothetical protein
MERTTMLTKKRDYKSLYAHNSSGIRGVSYDKTKKKWEVKVQRAGQRVRVGFFNDLRDAAAAHSAFIEENHIVAE